MAVRHRPQTEMFWNNSRRIEEQGVEYAIERTGTSHERGGKCERGKISREADPLTLMTLTELAITGVTCLPRWVERV